MGNLHYFPLTIIVSLGAVLGIRLAQEPFQKDEWSDVFLRLDKTGEILESSQYFRSRLIVQRGRVACQSATLLRDGFELERYKIGDHDWEIVSNIELNLNQHSIAMLRVVDGPISYHYLGILFNISGTMAAIFKESELQDVQVTRYEHKGQQNTQFAFLGDDINWNSTSVAKVEMVETFKGGENFTIIYSDHPVPPGLWRASSLPASSIPPPDTRCILINVAKFDSLYFDIESIDLVKIDAFVVICDEGWFSKSNRNASHNFCLEINPLHEQKRRTGQTPYHKRKPDTVVSFKYLNLRPVASHNLGHVASWPVFCNDWIRLWKYDGKKKFLGFSSEVKILEGRSVVLVSYFEKFPTAGSGSVVTQAKIQPPHVVWETCSMLHEWAYVPENMPWYNYFIAAKSPLPYIGASCIANDVVIVNYADHGVCIDATVVDCADLFGSSFQNLTFDPEEPRRSYFCAELQAPNKTIAAKEILRFGNPHEIKGNWMSWTMPGLYDLYCPATWISDHQAGGKKPRMNLVGESRYRKIVGGMPIVVFAYLFGDETHRCMGDCLELATKRINH